MSNWRRLRLKPEPTTVIGALAVVVVCSSYVASSTDFVASGFSRTSEPVAEQSAQPRVINIVAERFQFTPSRITLEEGTEAELRITSDDTDHGFRLSGPDAANVEIPKRGRGDVRVRFSATRVGVYTFECSQICGAGHEFMRGQIEVKPRRSSGTAEGPPQ